ncbi:glycosyltransferase family 2 protein [Lutimaribacter sp. EGI FJ00015]|uniref:Glycosyltransferase family 2 protein n=1 Tax=Lutimaribacter degradans TaxID=2945989 RepID=A0ACC5ZRI1_9RHOB|nr:glycosyltransferase family 2 protein [Lutimaribacter sp. EGI FJ00013]MCM2560882.1 glycosyltransferase family 2 protein [Lutimaribacter sp. EGI FJ00013]MCO0612173.1 glycosyltransferase family 2 protein [Lutimaribacter sp. EGI FJ00015]MCO0634707.1 glycosyltransferase family 2 protein [Lutimaribacter sp. EGI FJ00014]
MNSDQPTYPGGFPAILTQMEGRRAPLVYGPGEALPPLDVDFAPLKSARVDGRAPEMRGSRSSYARKFRDLSEEFDSLPELLCLHGLLIANLRRRGQPDHCAALFQRLWAEEADYLLARLDARWLVSAVTTFGDHGQTETQRRVGQSLTVLFGMMKLYETERLYSGAKPDQPFALKKKSSRTLPMQMDAYAIVGGGLDVNLLGRLWQEAQDDAVIAPLAHHLLDQLIHDPGGIFRRLRIMRARREKQLADDGIRKQKAQNDTAPVDAPVDHARVKTSPRSIRWGTVTLTNEPLARIARFAAHHLELGAARVTIYLDAPDALAEETFSRHPDVEVITCDDAWWARQKKPRMKAHQLRQVWVATQCYNLSDLDWLAHVDVDEFLLPDGPLPDLLAAVPADQAALLVPPAELLAGSQPEAFKLTPRMAGQDKSALTHLYPTFGSHLRGGFVSHLEGKLITRTGIPGLRLGLHTLTHEGAPVQNRLRSEQILLGHAHAPDWDTFRRHLDFRMTRGSYRKAEADRFKLRDVLAFLVETEGEPGLRAFFDEVCAASPTLVKELRARGMLVERPLNLDQAVARHFGPLPGARP